MEFLFVEVFEELGVSVSIGVLRELLFREGHPLAQRMVFSEDQFL
jgi:hypothetical protein